jgi:predicted mannosyl-3-phosphoglycerate phosphatase (HAD superfamily)
MKEARILGILIQDRIKEAGKTQKLLSENGHLIRSRLGFHEVSENVCSRVGMIIIQLTGSVDEWNKLEAQLNEIGGIEVKHMKFNL